MRFRYWISYVFTGLSLSLFGQIRPTNDQALQALVAGKQTVHEVMEIVQDYYAKQSPDGHFETQREFKKWMRWAYDAMRTAGPGNRFASPVNTLTELFRQEQKGGEAIEQQNSTPQWNFVGPETSGYITNPPSGINGLGRCDRIAFHPTDPNIIYVGTPMGGLWRTTNGGSNWTCLTSYLPVPGVSGIAVHPTNPSIVYIASGNADNVQVTQAFPSVTTSAGIFKTTDGGVNWELLPLPWDPALGVVVFRIVLSPLNPYKVLLATSDGLYRSIDGGNTWPSRPILHRVFDIEFLPGTDKCYFGGATNAGNARLYYSPNAAQAFNAIEFNGGTPSAINRMELALNPAPVGSYHTLYAFLGPKTGPGSFKGLYKMGGTNLMGLVRNSPNLFDSDISGSGSFDQSGYDHCIAVHPVNANTILTGGAIVFRSTDGGISMPFSTYYSEPSADLSQYVHPDIHDLAYNPLNNYVYAATDGGFYRSTNNGATWTNITNGIATSQFYGLAGYEPNHFYLMGGLQDNGVKYRNNSSSNMVHMAGADGFYTALSPSDTKVGYLSANQFFWRLTDLPNKSDVGINPTNTPQWAWRMQTDPVDGNYLYASDHNHDSIWISNNGGNTWFRRRFANGNRSIATCPSNTNRVYALGSFPIYDAANTTLRRSDNKGDTWSANLMTAPGLPPLSEVAPNAIAVYPANSNIVIMVYSGVVDGKKVYLSADAGANWVNISYNLPNVPINTVQIDNGLNTYIGTDYGVFHRRNGESNWKYFSNRLPRTIITQLVLNQTANILYASTFGRGIFYTNPYAPCLAALNVTGPVSGENVFEASGSLTSSAVIQGGEQTRVFFKSNDSIKLTTGFIATENVSEFKAALGPCGTGFPPLQTGLGGMAETTADAQYPIMRGDGYLKGTVAVEANALDKITLNLKEAGTVSLRVSAVGGAEPIILQPDRVMEPGNYSFSLPALPNSLLHFVSLVHNGVTIHVQEILQQ